MVSAAHSPYTQPPASPSQYLSTSETRHAMFSSNVKALLNIVHVITHLNNNK